MKLNRAFGTLALLLLSSPAFAGPTVSGSLVRLVAHCTTSDGQYTISITDNQGTGPNRQSHMSASVRNTATHEVEARYTAEQYRGMQSASFGRTKYQDSETAGRKFLLEGPSTNYRHYSVNVETNAEGQEPARIVDNDLECTVFGGVLLDQ